MYDSIYRIDQFIVQQHKKPVKFEAGKAHKISTLRGGDGALRHSVLAAYNEPFEAVNLWKRVTLQLSDTGKQ